MDAAKNKLVFILGHGRSGTTLLNKVLSAHPDIYFFTREFNDLPFFYENRDLYKMNRIIDYNAMGADIFCHPRLGIKPAPKLRANDFRSLCCEIFNYYRQREAKPIIGIKVANNIPANVNLIKKFFPDAYCIHITRDPRDIFLSLRKTGFGGKSPYYIAKSWKENVEKILELKKSISDYFEIEYADLIKDPSAKIKELCRSLNIDFNDRMLEFEKFIEEKLPRHHQNLSRGFLLNNSEKWKGVLSDTTLELIYAGAGNLINNKGYSENLNIHKIGLGRRFLEFINDKVYNYKKIPKRFFKNPFKIYLWKIKLKRIIKL